MSGRKISYPEFFADEVMESADMNNRGPVHDYFLDKGVSKRDLVVKTFYLPEGTDIEAWIDDPSENEFYGFELNNGDYVYTCPGVQPIYVKCKDFESMKNHVVNSDNFRRDIVE